MADTDARAQSAGEPPVPETSSGGSGEPPHDGVCGPDTSAYDDGTPRAMTQTHRVGARGAAAGTGKAARRRRRGPLEWMFRNRLTGGITVAQLPNAPLVVWFAASLVQRWWNPQVAGHDVLTAVSTGALLVWAADELVRGVNPFRRLLGAVAVIWTAYSLTR